MSQLVRLEGKHTAQTAHCALDGSMGCAKKIKFKICEADPGNCLVYEDFTVDKCSKVYVGKTFQALLPVEAWLHWLHSLFNQKDKTVFVAIIIGGGNHDIIMAFFLPIRIPSLWMG